jgi:hypothetical protein
MTCLFWPDCSPQVMTSVNDFSGWSFDQPGHTLTSIIFSIVLLFICAYKAWVISPPCPHPLPYHPLLPLPTPPPPQYPAETILPLSLILLKREYKQ